MDRLCCWKGTVPSAQRQLPVRGCAGTSSRSFRKCSARMSGLNAPSISWPEHRGPLFVNTAVDLDTLPNSPKLISCVERLFGLDQCCPEKWVYEVSRFGHLLPSAGDEP